MSGGSSTAAGGSAAPFAGAVQEAQAGFGGNSVPWAGTQGTAQQSALSGIQGINTNPAAQYGNAQAVGQNLTTQGNNLAGQASGAYAAGSDPQNALYAQQYQQNQDQTNAQNAMSGVAATPYGAALSNQSGQNFNLNWQNQQLQRENTAANTASTLAGAGTSEAGAGLTMGQSIDSQQANAQNTQIQDYIQYLLGNTSNSSALLSSINNSLGGAVSQAGVTNTGAQQSAAQGAASLGGLGSLIGGIGKLGTAFL